MKVAAIDLDGLRKAASDGDGPTAVVSRAALGSILRALSGEPFASISDSERQLKIVAPIGGAAA